MMKDCGTIVFLNKNENRVSGIDKDHTHLTPASPP